MLLFVSCEENLSPRFFLELFRNDQHQKLLFGLKKWCEVFRCGHHCTARVRHYKNFWSNVHTQIFDVFTPTGPATKKVWCKGLKFHGCFRTEYREVWKNLGSDSNISSVNSGKYNHFFSWKLRTCFLPALTSSRSVLREVTEFWLPATVYCPTNIITPLLHLSTFPCIYSASFAYLSTATIGCARHSQVTEPNNYHGANPFDTCTECANEARSVETAGLEPSGAAIFNAETFSSLLVLDVLRVWKRADNPAREQRGQSDCPDSTGRTRKEQEEGRDDIVNTG